MIITPWTSSSAATRPDLPAQVCPDPSAGEEPEDCPWAAVARSISAQIAARQPALPVIERLVPDLLKHMQSDATRKDWLGLWGRSINFDEGVKGIIVEPQLLQELHLLFGLRPPEERIVHAGVEHTYGYLFSNLKTPFGFKRRRWVRPTLDQGFGLPTGTITPLPERGTLLANVTYFTGRIAFRGEPARLATLKEKEKGLRPELLRFGYAGLKISRLMETLELNGRKVVLRTDFVPFQKPVPGDSNSFLLIYSVEDTSQDGAQLITAFPVEKGFVDRALSPEGLGENKPIVTRYNAHVDGVTGQKLTGTRLLAP